NGQCAANKPSQCTNGQLVDNAAACGCPAGQLKTANGTSCAAPPNSCRYNTTTCPPTSTCNYTASNALDLGVCQPKQGCNGGIVTCDPSYQKCDSSVNPNGVCVTAPGKCQSNIDCAKGQACVSNSCQAASSSTTGSVAAVSAPSTTNSTSAPSGSSPLACCPCIPAVGGVMLVGVALFKRNENEE
ncbi:MAG: hypothetical protein KGH63_02415, partial [Candidatus Micrarchaeota archaeon]|nr:hypothetical protein [Candidatus Micrarchaeota archaeon]